MAGTTLALFDAILKYDYKGPISDQINNSTILMARLKKNEEDVVGKSAVVPLHTARNSGIGAAADGGSLPTAGYQGYVDAIYSLKHNYGRIQVTGPTIAASKNNKGAFIKAVDAEIRGCVEDLKNDINRQLFLDGTGVLCLVNTDPSTGTTLTVDNPGAKYLQKGMIIDIVDPSSTTAGDARANATGLTISAKASSTTATLSAAAHGDIADNDFVVRKGNYLNEMMGLAGIISNANPRSLAIASLYVGGINRATAGNEFWDAQVLSNSGTARKLTLDLMQEAFDLAEEEGGEISLLLTSRAQRRKYLALVKADGRFVNTMKLDGGFDALEYNGVPLVVDKHCQDDVIYFIDEKTLQVYRSSDVEWAQEDGAVLSRVSGYDAYEAFLYYYATLGCNACNRNAVLKDLATT